MIMWYSINMNIEDVFGRLILFSFLLILAFIAPLSVTIIFSLICMIFLPYYIEGIVLIMLIISINQNNEYKYIPWLLLLLLMIINQVRQKFRTS